MIAETLEDYQKFDKDGLLIKLPFHLQEKVFCVYAQDGCSPDETKEKCGCRFFRTIPNEDGCGHTHSCELGYSVYPNTTDVSVFRECPRHFLEASEEVFKLWMLDDDMILFGDKYEAESFVNGVNTIQEKRLKGDDRF